MITRQRWMSWDSQDIIRDPLYAPPLCEICKRQESFKAVSPDISEHIRALRSHFRTLRFINAVRHPSKHQSPGTVTVIFF